METSATRRPNSTQAFTLIELSIVLVIIGLIVGGVLVGKDLVQAAAIRSQISQIEKYQVAVNTFRLKYNGLPGDLKNAAQFGFPARGSLPGRGDGNGVLECNTGGGVSGNNCNIGELPLFWVDLSAANLISESFILGNASAYSWGGGVTPNSSPVSVKDFFPQAKLGSNNFITAFSGGYYPVAWSNWISSGQNYFMLQNISWMNTDQISPSTERGLTSAQAFAIDTKIDDGLPQTGKVLAQYMAFLLSWTGVFASGPVPPYKTGDPTTAATNGSATTCYDNGGVAGQSQKYSIASNPSTLSCALSFQFQ